MKFFLHTLTRIRIVNEDQEFECSPARFAELEPDYPGLPEGVTSRYWTAERAYFDAGAYDGHDCGPYCDRVATYTHYPVIYADVTLSKATINVGNAQDAITFTANLEDGDGNTLPISYDWFIRLTHEVEGDVDRILLDFVNGACSKVYTFLSGNPLGMWRVDESKFDLIAFGGQTYAVRLIAPIEFVAYRSL